MTRPATIRSERLLLRPACGEDLSALLTLWREPEVRRYLFDGDVPTREQAARYLSGQRSVWLLQRLAGPELLGCVTLRETPGGAREPGVALHPQHQGRGFAQEALSALLAHAAEALGAKPLVASCCVPDAAGQRLLHRLGFVAGYECDGGRYRVRQYRKERPLHSPPASPCVRSAALPSCRLAVA